VLVRRGSNANCSADRISFKNPSDLDTGNTDESCFYCDYYYDSNGYLQKGNLDTANKQAVPRLGFTVDNTKYSNYKIKIGNVEVASWIPISSSTVTYDGLRVKEGATSDSVSDSILTITYGNGTAAKTYAGTLSCRKQEGEKPTGYLLEPLILPRSLILLSRLLLLLPLYTSTAMFNTVPLLLP